MLFVNVPVGAALLVNTVVPPAQLESATFDLARRIAARPPFGIRLAKAGVNRSVDAQGLQLALDNAFSLHHVGHANNLARYGTLIDPDGIAFVRGTRSA